MALLAVDQDHHVVEVSYDAGNYIFTKRTGKYAVSHGYEAGAGQGEGSPRYPGSE